MSRRYLLAIDGGGVRGIIPAVALAKLEATTGRLVRDTFSFVADTSTGAIIDTTIAAGVPAARIVSLYLDRAREVFTGLQPLSETRPAFFSSAWRAWVWSMPVLIRRSTIVVLICPTITLVSKSCACSFSNVVALPAASRAPRRTTSGSPGCAR